MHKLYVKSFVPSDALLMNFRDKEEYNELLRVIPNYFTELAEMCQGNAYTIYKDNEIIAITGWVPSIMNFCQIWFFAAEDLQQKFNIEAFRIFNSILEKAKQEWERIETTCKENKRNKRFLEKLGFKQECLMRKYGFFGEDMYLYAIIR